MSTTYELNAQVRTALGKGNSRRARKEGLIPAVVYSKGKAAEAIMIKENEWTILVNNKVKDITLVVGDSKKNVVMQDIQENFLKGQVVHIDFLEV